MKMRKNSNLLFTLALLLIILGCNKNDDNPDPNNIPSTFEITVSDITSNTAKLSWTASTTAEPTSITYAIYLNDLLLAENLAEISYNLNDLENATIYTVKVEAKNEFGTTPSSKDFTTLQQVSLRLKSYKEDHYEFILDYNQAGLLIYRGDPSSNGYTNIDFTYNQNDRILTEYSRYRDASGNPSARLTYEYTNTTLTGLTIHQTGEDFTEDFDFQFDTPLNYSYTVTQELFDGGPPEVYIYNYVIALETDSNNNIITYSRTNIDNSHVDRVYFEYENGNLTKITNGSNVLEISYDTSNNWHTYRSGFMPYIYNYWANDVGSFIYIPNLIGWLNQIPHFYNFININNPTEYKVNGSVVRSFEYQYNSSNYPSKIIIPQNSVTIDLEYEAVE